MLLYHGSNVVVSQPKILESDRKLDFGTGFYLTSSLEQAKKWAVLTTKRKGNGVPTVFVFEFNDFLCLNSMQFSSANADWLKYVSKNRKGTPVPDEYDLVIGPVADDKTMPVLNLYFSEVYDEKETIKRLLPQKLQDQYVCKTEKALSKLLFKEVLTNE